MALGSTHGKMDAPTKVSTSMTRNTVKGSIIGLMVENTTEIGKMENNMVKDYTGPKTQNSQKEGSGTKEKETNGSLSE